MIEMNEMNDMNDQREGVVVGIVIVEIVEVEVEEHAVTMMILKFYQVETIARNLI